MRLKDKKIIVTAAAQGIGRATAMMFAKEGASVIATDINEEKLIELNKENNSIKTQKLDATNKNAVEDFRSQGVNVVIGPLDNKDFNEVKKFNDIVFISPSNKTPEFENNIISIGVSFESQMLALVNFIKKQKN